MILLTGATGTIGSALLRRLVADRQPVRCLVRDPRGLGEQRVRVQIALGDLAEPASFRNALRGVQTVIHLGASIRDQPRGSIEELNAVATMRLVRAAERSGVERFVFFSALGAALHSRTRFFRAKALARQAVEDASLATTVFSPSIVYSPGRSVAHAAGAAVAAARRAGVGLGAGAVPADLGRGRGRLRGGGAERTRRRTADAASSWPGPQTLSYDAIVRTAMRPLGRRRPLLHVPLPVVRLSLGGARARGGPGRLRHLGGGRADGGADDQRPRHRRRRVARASTRWR